MNRAVLVSYVTETSPITEPATRTGPSWGPTRTRQPGRDAATCQKIAARHSTALSRCGLRTSPGRTVVCRYRLPGWVDGSGHTCWPAGLGGWQRPHVLAQEQGADRFGPT